MGSRRRDRLMPLPAALLLSGLVLVSGLWLRVAHVGVIITSAVALGVATLLILHRLQQMQRRITLLQAIWDGAGAGMIAFDAEGRIRQWNPAAGRLLGMDEAGLAQTSIWELVPVAQHEGFRMCLAELAAAPHDTKHPRRCELRGIGRLATDLSVALGYANCGGEMLYTAVLHDLGVAQDVTRRKHAEDALTSVLDTVGDSVVVADEEGRIVMANRQVEEVFGYYPDELIGRNMSELVPPHLAAAQEAGPARLGINPEGLVFNRRLQSEGLHRNGRVFPMEIFVGTTQIGNQLHYTASMRDITQEKELERLRDDFISTVSHELRTPLASIMGWLETTLEGRPGPLNEAQTRFLGIAYTSAERLNRLVEEILTVSRINRGTLRLQKVPFDPSQVVTAAVDMLDSIAADRDIAIIVNDNWPLRETLVGDRDRFDQVLANLLSNAVKFSPNGGVVEVRSEKVEDAWRLEVADHGIGIPHDELHRLFQRFYRASNAAQAKIQGTGLGLYICKAIVEGHGGRIGIQSDVGMGTTVWFSVPVARLMDDTAEG